MTGGLDLGGEKLGEFTMSFTLKGYLVFGVLQCCAQRSIPGSQSHKTIFQGLTFFIFSFRKPSLAFCRTIKLDP